MRYNRYWNRRANRLFNNPTWRRWEPKLDESVPGHKFDPKNKKPGGFNRFERWYKLPVKAWKLYWKLNPRPT